MERITVYINDELEEKIEEEIDNKDVSKSKLVREALNEHYKIDELREKLHQKDDQIQELKEEINELHQENRDLKSEKDTFKSQIENKNSTIQSKDKTINTLQTQLSIMRPRNIDQIKNKANPLSRFFLAMALGFSGVEVEKEKFNND